VKRFEPSAPNADDNDCGGFSGHGSWDGFDELTQTAGSYGKSYKREARPQKLVFESNRMMGNLA
jgi:hypothetical protein